MRPTTRVGRALDWFFPGEVYRPEVRNLRRAGNKSLLSGAGNYDLSGAANERLLVNRVHLILVDETGWADTEFGNIAALATGLRLQLLKGGVLVHEFTGSAGADAITNNSDMFAATAPDYLRVTLDAANEEMAVATWDFVGSFAPVLLDATNDTLRFIVAAGDTFTGIARLEARADTFLVVTE